MKIYIAGKIAGDRRYRAKFREATKILEGVILVAYTAADLAVFLPDYRESRGAMVEWAWCQRTGKECAMYLDMAGGGAK